jgi:hypothetical protein
MGATPTFYSFKNIRSYECIIRNHVEHRWGLFPLHRRNKTTSKYTKLVLYDELLKPSTEDTHSSVMYMPKLVRLST